MLRAIALALRARLRLSRSASAAARSLNRKWLRIFLLMPQPPLLFKEGNVASFQIIHTFHERLFFPESTKYGRS
jgi:hypothetical protein